ncbi:MAG: TonB-dependent receptor [Polyangiales bacterium]
MSCCTHRRYGPSVLMLLLACALPQLAVAQTKQSAPPEEGGNIESLEALLNESVVTTASRSAERATAAPSAMATITAEDIRRFGIRSIDEALAFLGVGMRVEKARDYYTGLDVGARGLMLRDYGRHLLVLLDGHVMNSQASGEITLHEGLGVPLEAIDHIEIMLGAGSVMYGANAMTAVVHVITKQAYRERGVHAVAELSVAAPSGVDGYARTPGGGRRAGFHYRLGLGGAEEFALLGQRGSIAVRAEWQENISQTYEVAPVMGDNLQLRPGESTWGGHVAHTMTAPSVITSVRWGDFALRAQAVAYERTMPMVSIYDDQRAQEQRGAVRIDLSHAKQLSRTLHLTSRVYADYMRQSERTYWTSPWWCAPGQIDGCEYRTRTVSRWLGLEQQLRYEPAADGSLSTVVGYDLRLRDGSGRPADYRDAVTGEYPAVQLPYFHEESVLGAVFLQQLYMPTSWLSLNAGVRLDIDSLFGARPSPRIAVMVFPAEGASLRTSYSEAFRGPTAQELYASDPTYVLTPRELGPEVVRTIELEWQQRFTSLSIILRGWLSFYDEFINERPATLEETDRGIASGELASSVDPSYVVVNDNVDRIDTYGGTLVLHARPGAGLSLTTALTVSRSHAVGLTDAPWPRLFGNFRAAYELSAGGPTLALAGVYAAARQAFNSYADDPAAAAATDVGGALDLRLTLTTPIQPLPGFSVRAGVGARVFPDAPYLITGPTDGLPRTPMQYNHEQPQLHLLLGVAYDP